MVQRLQAKIESIKKQVGVAPRSLGFNSDDSGALRPESQSGAPEPSRLESLSGPYWNLQWSFQVISYRVMTSCMFPLLLPIIFKIE